MTSSPLLTRVEELVVMTSPMSQVGCASASAGVTRGELARDAPAERPAACRQHEPAHLVGARPRAAPARSPSARSRRERSARARARLVTSEPPTMRLSLFASASVRPALERRERRREPDRAGDAVEHDVAVDVPDELARPHARRARRAPPRSARACCLDELAVATRGEPDDAGSGRGSPRSPRAPARRSSRWSRG